MASITKQLNSKEFQDLVQNSLVKVRDRTKMEAFEPDDLEMEIRTELEAGGMSVDAVELSFALDALQKEGKIELRFSSVNYKLITKAVINIL